VLAGGILLILLALGYLLAPDGLEQRNRMVAWLLAVGVGIQPCVELIPVILIVSAGFWGLQWHGIDRAMPFIKMGAGILLLISGILSLWHGH
jgi:hypothetical protein